MSDQIRELADIPKDFIRDGTQFINRCQKRMFALSPYKQHLRISCAISFPDLLIPPTVVDYALTDCSG
jgi:hypothetical protein